MAYFLGRDVDVYITTESANNDFITVASNTVDLDSSATSGACIPPLVNDAAVLSGSISDVTGVDLSISVSDEDVGPFLGKPQIMQKIELRKETTVSFTRKKSDNFWDVVFNGPSTDFSGDANNALRMGARLGVEYPIAGGFYGTGGTTEKIADGSSFMYNTLESGSTTLCCYGYRLHLSLKDNTSGEIITIKNAVMTGHTVTLNVDGVTEETCEFSSSVAYGTATPSGLGTGFDTALTTIAEL